MLRIFLVSFLLFNTNVFAEDLKKVYFGGGCFWCMEESFDKAEGVKDVISGYSGGTTKNPTYKEVTYGNTGHFEVVEIVYDSKITNFENLLNIFWKNIEHFTWPHPFGPLNSQACSESPVHPSFKMNGYNEHSRSWHHYVMFCWLINFQSFDYCLGANKMFLSCGQKQLDCCYCSHKFTF